MEAKDEKIFDLLAAKSGHAVAQNYLARLYCPDQEPCGALKVWRLSRFWLEEAVARKLPVAMENLALCLRCGKCACCDRDIPRAEALESEANEIESIPRTWT